jgi:phosphate transport system substrate-binding protein
MAVIAQPPDTTFDIPAAASPTCLAAIIDGTAQIGIAKPAGEAIRSNRLDKNMKPTIVAYDGMGS